MDFSLSPAIFAALASAIGLPMLLIFFSHGPLRIAPPGRRFVVTSVIVMVIWLGAIIMGGVNLPDAAAGVLILATALLVGFTIWTLIAWGFTLTMLRALADARRPISPEEWVVEYTGGQDLQAFGKDRLSLLLKSRLGVLEGERVLPTSKGRFGARVGFFLRWLLAIKA